MCGTWSQDLLYQTMPVVQLTAHLNPSSSLTYSTLAGHNAGAPSGCAPDSRRQHEGPSGRLWQPPHNTTASAPAAAAPQLFCGNHREHVSTTAAAEPAAQATAAAAVSAGGGAGSGEKLCLAGVIALPNHLRRLASGCWHGCECIVATLNLAWNLECATRHACRTRCAVCQ